MADRYWRGGSGTWNTSSTTNWSTSSGGSGGASVPTATDNVIFDQAGSYTVALSGALTCLDFTVSAGTVTFSSTGTPTISGSMSLVSGTVWSGTGAITFNATTTGKTITTNGTTINGSITLNGVGGEWSLGSELTVSSSDTTTLTNGSLLLNGFDLTTGSFISTNTNTRSIAFGTNNINLTSVAFSANPLQMATATGFTYTGSGGFYVPVSSGNARAFSFGSSAGGSSSNAPNLTFTTDTSNIGFNSDSWFNNLDFGTTSSTVNSTTINLVNNLTLSSSGTYTSLRVNIQGSGTITYNGRSSSAVTLFSGSPTIADTITCTTFTINGPTYNFTSGTINPSTSFVVTSGGFTYNGGTLGAVPTFTHTAGTVTFNYSYSLTVTGTYTLTAGTLILADGVTLTTGIFSSSNANTRSIQFGSASAGNIQLTHTTAATTVLSMSTLTNFTYTGPGGFTVDDMSVARSFGCGSIAGGSTTNAPNLTFTTGASVATLNTGGWFKNLNFGTTSFTLGTTTLNIAGNLTLSATGTYTAMSINPQATGTYTFNGKSIAAFPVNVSGITITMASNGGCSVFTMTLGTVDFASYNFTCSSTATYNSGTLSNFGTFSCTTFTNNGTLALTSGSINPSTSFVQAAGSFTLSSTATIGATTPTFTHTSGSVTFNASQSLAITGTYTLTAGTLTLADGVTLTTGIFSSSNANTRSIQFGSASAGNIQLTHTTAATTVLSMSTLTNFTYTGPGGFTVDDMSVARTFTCGIGSGSSANAPNLTFTTGASIATITTGSYFNKLDFGTASFTIAATTVNINSLTLSSTGTFTALIVSIRGTGTLTYNGGTTAAVSLFAGSPTIADNVTCTTFTVNGGTFNFISGTLTPTTSFVISNSGSFTYNGGTLSATLPTFTQTLGTATFNYSYSLAVTGTYTLSGGTLTLADGVTLSTGIFSSSNTNTRSINFGTTSAGNIQLTHTTAATVVLSMTSVTRFSCSGPGGFTVDDMSVARTFTCGTSGSTSFPPNLTFTTGASVATITTSGVLKKLDFGTTSFTLGSTTIDLTGLTLSSSGTYTSLTVNIRGSGTLTYNGKTTAAVTLYSGIPTIADTINCTTFTVSNTTFDFTSGTINPSVSFVVGGGTNTNNSASFIYNGGTLAAVPTFDHQTGTVTFNYSYSLTTTGTYTLATNGSYAATLILADGVTLNTGIFSSATIEDRAVAFGTNSAGNINLTGTGTVLNITLQTTRMTYTGPGGFTVAAMSNTRTFTCTGGATTGWTAPNLTFTTGSSTATFTSNSYFNNLDFGTTSFSISGTATNIYANNVTLSTGTYTSLNLLIMSAGTVNLNGKTIGIFTLYALPTFTSRIITCTEFEIDGFTFDFTSGASDDGLLHTINATTFTLTSGAFIYNNGTLSVTSFSQAAGTATFNYSYTQTGSYTLSSGSLILADGITLSIGSFSSNGSSTRSIQFGSASASNINLTNTTAATTVLSMATITGFTYTGPGGFYVPTSGNTRSFTCGSTAGGTATNAPNLTFGSGASGITITTGSWFNNLDFGTTSFTVSVTTINVETITLSSSGSYTNVTLNMVDTGTLTGNGRTITALVLLNGSTTIVGTLLCSTVEVNGGTFSFTSGTITPSTSVTITSGSFTYGGTATLGSVATFTQTADTVTFNKSYSLTTTGTYAFTSGTLTLADGITLATGIFSGSNTNTRSIAFGSASAGNINLTHTTALTVVLSMSILTGFTVSGPGGFTVATMTNTRTFTCGVTGGTTTNAPNLTFTTGASVATITTNGYFNKLDYGTTSFTQATSTVNVNSITLSSSGTYTSLTVSIRGTGTLTYNGKTTSNVTLFSGSPTIVGTVTCATFTVNGGIWDFTTGTLSPSTSFVISSGSFTYNGGTLSAQSTFTHTAGTVTFNFSYALVATGTYTLTAGTLTLADGVTLSTGIFSSSNSNTRSIQFGSAGAGNIQLTHTTAATTVLDMATITGFTYTGPGGFTVPAMSNTRTFSCGSTAGGTTTNAPRLTFTTGASVATITSGSYFNKLDFGTTSFTIAATTLNINSLTLSSTGTYTALSLNIIGSGTLTYNTKVSAAVVLLAGTPTIADTIACTTFTINGPDYNFTSGAIAPTTSFVLTSGSFTYNGGILGNVPTFTHTAGTVTITKPCNIPNASYSLNGGTLSIGDNITLTVSAFISNNSTTRTIAFGTTSAGNIVLSSVIAATTVLSMATLTNFTYTGLGGFTVDAMNYTRTFTCGSTAGGTATNAPNLTFGTGASTATMTTGSWFNNLDFGTTSFTLGTTTLNTAGNLTLSSGGTYTALTASMVGTGTFNNNSKSITGLTINTTGTATLGSALTMSGALTLTQGTLYCPYNMTSASFASTGTLTRSIVGSNITYLINGSGATAFSNASATGITLSGFTINMDSASAKTFAGGGGSYPILNNGGAGALTISGSNTFDTISNSVQPTTFTFTIATTQTVRNFNVAGTSGNLVTINSTLAASVATLSKASGIVSGSYLSIRDSTATGGATWYAGPTSTNTSNNTGWLFTVLSVITMGSLSITAGGIRISTAAV